MWVAQLWYKYIFQIKKLSAMSLTRLSKGINQTWSTYSWRTLQLSRNIYYHYRHLATSSELSESLSVWTPIQNDAFPRQPHADGIIVCESEMPAFLDLAMQTSASESCLYQVGLPASSSARRQEVKSTCHVTKADTLLSSWVYTRLKESARVNMMSCHTSPVLTPTLHHLKEQCTQKGKFSHRLLTLQTWMNLFFQSSTNYPKFYFWDVNVESISV